MSLVIATISVRRATWWIHIVALLRRVSQDLRLPVTTLLQAEFISVRANDLLPAASFPVKCSPYASCYEAASTSDHVLVVN